MRKLKDNLILSFFISSMAIVLIILIIIVGYVVIKGLPALNWEFLSTKYKGDSTGIYPMIITTIIMIFITLLIATPIGVSAAIYLQEYANENRLMHIIEIAIETLAGVPSIIYGLFGFLFFSNLCNMGYSILSGSLTMVIMVLPTIIRISQESLAAVNISIREGSLALGATKLITIFKVVLPGAIPGIATGIILSIGRIVGETAAIYFAAGISPRVPTSIFSSGRTLSVHLYLLAKEGAPLEQTFATATVLLVLVMSINMLANYGMKRIGTSVRKNSKA